MWILMDVVTAKFNLLNHFWMKWCWKLLKCFQGHPGSEAKALLERQLLDGFFINRGPDKSIGVKYRKSQHTGWVCHLQIFMFNVFLQIVRILNQKRSSLELYRCFVWSWRRIHCPSSHPWSCCWRMVCACCGSWIAPPRRKTTICWWSSARSPVEAKPGHVIC